MLSAKSPSTSDDYVRVLKEHLGTPTTISRYQSICGSEGAVLSVRLREPWQSAKDTRSIALCLWQNTC